MLAKWIDDGLPWEAGFSFKPSTYVAPLKPRTVALPAAQPGRDHPIDRILDAYFAVNKVAAPPPLDDAAFARRVYFDLIGLPPAACGTRSVSRRSEPGQASSARPKVARRGSLVHRPLAGVLERPAPQRVSRHRLHRRRAEADHGLALQVAAGEQALRPVRPRTDQPDARFRGLRARGSGGAAR